MYWQICSWTGVMPSSGNSFYQSSSHLLSFDNGTGCWHGAGSWDSPPLYASGTCQRWKCRLSIKARQQPMLAARCHGMGLAPSSVAAAILRMGIQSGPCHHGRPGGNFKPALFLQGDRGSGADVQLPLARTNSDDAVLLLHCELRCT